MPTANTDSTSTPQATPVTIAVLANDDGAGLMVTGYTEPGAGSLALNPDGSFTYTPVAGFSGSDGFTYAVRDAAGATATAMVTITVARPNAPPRAEADTAQVTAGGSIVLPVLANDVDPEDDQLTLLLVEAPGHGTV
jgi:Bacterial Ig domain/Bacterial cadherin-like domain